MTDQSYNTQLSEFLPTGTSAHPTMSSVDIAELTGKDHKNVLADIRSMLDGLKSQPISETTYRDKGNREKPCFNLPKRECLILVSGYSVELRAKVIDRWMELEQAKPAPAAIDFSDPAILLGVVGHLQSTVGQQALVIAEQGDRLKNLDRIEAAYGSMCLTDAAKTLKKGPQELIRFMQSRDMIYKRVGNTSWIGRQRFIGAGQLEHKEHVYIGSDGVERVATRVMVTGKGLVKLAEMLESPLH